MTQNDPLSQWFAIPAFFVVFRETLEAVVLMAVMLQYLERAGHHEMCRQVWLGGAAGGAMAFAFGVVVLSIYYSAHQSLDTDIALIVEGIMLGSASVLISYFFVTHLAPGMKSDDQWKTKWERKMKEMIEEEMRNTDGKRSNFFMLTLTNVFREGVEAVVFITGIGAMYTPEALVVPSIAGLLVGCLMGIMMFIGSKKLDLSGFFIFSAVLLLFIAAGLSSHAMYEFQKAGVFGPWACHNCATDDLTDDLPSGYRRLSGDDDESCGDDIPSWNAYRRLSDMEDLYRRLDTGRSASCDGVDGRNVPWVNREVYDITGCCDTSNMFFFLMMVLFWYRPAPSNLEVITYCLYWPCVFIWGYAKVRSIKEFNETLVPTAEPADVEEPTMHKILSAPSVTAVVAPEHDTCKEETKEPPQSVELVVVAAPTEEAESSL